jgi:hypothetical protein
MATHARLSLLLGVLMLFPAGRAADAQAFGGACRQDYAMYCSGVAQGGGRILECLNAHLPQLSPGCRAHVAGAGSAPAAPPAAVVAAPRPPAPASSAKAEVAEACGPDIRDLCSGLPQGGGKIGQCLKDHFAQLTPVCRTSLTAARPEAAPATAVAPPPAMAPVGPAVGPSPPVAGTAPSPSAPAASAKAAVGEACMTDIHAYCASVPQGGGLIGQCLKEHASQLSSGCRSALIAARSAK